jgi:chemotaxis protein MotB
MAKKHKHEEHENHERWLVSYADFITLLFAFFVVLYASADKSDAKTKAVEDSIRSALHMVLEGGGGADLINMETGQMIAPLGSFQPLGSPIDMQRYYQKQIESKLSQEERGKTVQDIEHDLNGVRIRLVDTNLFNPGSAELNPQSLEGLKKIADILRRTKQEVVIEGHTDNIPVNGGSFNSNWELGAMRAVAVLRYMQSVFNFPKDKLSAASYADTRPIEPNDSPEGRARNRRIELYVVSKPKAAHEIKSHH